MATAIDDNVEGKNLGKQLVKLSTGQHTSIVSRYDTEDFEFCGIRRSGNTAISTVSEYIRKMIMELTKCKNGKRCEI